jgi:hypothetical protein
MEMLAGQGKTYTFCAACVTWTTISNAEMSGELLTLTDGAAKF